MSKLHIDWTRNWEDEIRPSHLRYRALIKRPSFDILSRPRSQVKLLRMIAPANCLARDQDSFPSELMTVSDTPGRAFIATFHYKANRSMSLIKR